MDMVSWSKGIAKTIHREAHCSCKFALFLDKDYTNNCLHLHNHKTSLLINARGIERKCRARSID